MSVRDILEKFHAVAAHPAKQFHKYLDAGEKVVLAAPVYTPEEIIHAMGLVPFGAWGGDLPLEKSKEYFPAFLCSVVQSIVELGIRGEYTGAVALVVPSLCDSLKCLGQNWKYAVPSIPFVPMTYPQNRWGDELGKPFTMAGYRRLAADLEKATGAQLTDEALSRSIAVYNEHNAVMREVDAALAAHPEVTARQRSDVFKSAWFLRKEEHTALVRELLDALNAESAGTGAVRVMVSGIVCDSPALLDIFDTLGLQIVADDVAAQSRQYRTDTPAQGAPLDALAEKFARMDNCSVLYDPQKKRPGYLVKAAQARGAQGVVVVLTKFCDPEEFDYPFLKRACDEAGLPIVLIEVDRQMDNFEQARTALEAFRDMLA